MQQGIRCGQNAALNTPAGSIPACLAGPFASKGAPNPSGRCDTDFAMPKTPADLLSYLESLGIEVSTVSHPPLFTVADSQALRGEIAGGHTKNLFLKDKKDNFFLVTVEEDAEVDLKQIHHLIGASGRVSFGKPEALMEFLGVIPGAVTAFGLINDGSGAVKFVIDSALMEHRTINAHPLTNEATTSIAADDLLRFARATGHEPTILKVSA
jgi:Ala-tRNA(Pro) deacylase